MHDASRYRLLHGPYTAPALERGDRVTCFYRDADVIITGWSDARIPWPRCRLPGTRGGGSGLLVDAELARAVRCESMLAICYRSGVVPSVVWRWRKALGVEKLNEGSRLLRNALNAELGAGLKGKRLPPEACQRRRQTAEEMNQGQYLWNGSDPVKRWTAADLAHLGTLPDEDLAVKLGRAANAVRIKRTRLGIASACDRRRRENRA
jgi:hypothetical protein